VSHSLFEEDSILVECDAVFFVEWRPKIQGILLPSLQGLAIKKFGLFESKYEITATFARRHVPVEM
jgi:hypothetical protein